MYYVFLDAVSTTGYIGLYHSTSREYITSQSFSILGNESTKLLDIVHIFLEEHTRGYEEVDTIVCVVGPGSFTGVRTISLIINSLAYSYLNIHLTPVNFFDLYDEYPIVKSSSKRDVFVKYDKNDIIHIVKNEVFSDNYREENIFGDVDIGRFEKEYQLFSKIDYTSYMQSLEIKEKKQLAPLYIKKPNIS